MTTSFEFKKKVEYAKLKIERLTNGNQNPNQEDALPESLLNPPGFVGQLCSWINDTAIRQQPVLALAASLSFFGSIVGRKVAGPGDARTNLYCIGLAASGSGKEHPRKCIKKLVHAAGITDDVMGGEEISSDAAIQTCIKKRPSVIFMLDEIGHFLSNVNHRNSPAYLRAISSTFTKLFGCSSSLYISKEYADQKNNPRVIIIEPNVCLFGTTVPSRFFKSISPDEVMDGFLSRLLVFQSTDPVPPRRSPESFDPPEHLVNFIQHWWKMDSRPAVQTGNLNRVINNAPIIFKADDKAKEIFDRFADTCDQNTLALSEVDGSGLEALWARALEHSIKVALTVSCGIPGTTTEINHECADYGVQLVSRLVSGLVESVRHKIGHTELDRNEKAILKVVADSADKGITMARLSRLAPPMTPNDRKQILQNLMEKEHIVHVRGDGGQGKGRPASIFYINIPNNT